jgi:hypothetical protein
MVCVAPSRPSQAGLGCAYWARNTAEPAAAARPAHWSAGRVYSCSVIAAAAALGASAGRTASACRFAAPGPSIAVSTESRAYWCDRLQIGERARQPSGGGRPEAVVWGDVPGRGDDERARHGFQFGHPDAETGRQRLDRLPRSLR